MELSSTGASKQKTRNKLKSLYPTIKSDCLLAGSLRYPPQRGT